MGAVFDYIASAIVTGILVLTMTRVQTSMNSTRYLNTFTVIAQRNAVELARQIEYDFLKIGYHVRGQKIFFADTNRLLFRSDLLGNHDTVFVAYTTGTPSQALQTDNPNDFPLFRTMKGFTIVQHWGLTRFHISYRDTLDKPMVTPITTVADLRRIAGIDVQFSLRSPEQVVTLDSVYTAGVEWQKLIYPRNLHRIDY